MDIHIAVQISGNFISDLISKEYADHTLILCGRSAVRDTINTVPPICIRWLIYTEDDKGLFSTAASLGPRGTQELLLHLQRYSAGAAARQTGE